MKAIIRKTPKTMYHPVGKYSHTTIIPAGMDTYVFSGQIGIRDDGALPAAFNDEVQQLFKNIKALRGFKFKVQHPVLGYWRLLKKLHRVS